jgi:FKBP-type peptidyl-prolyl cis-trans isomerase 2
LAIRSPLRKQPFPIKAQYTITVGEFENVNLHAKRILKELLHVSFLSCAGEVIKGWDLGLEGMREGGKRTLVIPSGLGYGKRGAGRDIPPNSDLTFDVQLIKCK